MNPDELSALSWLVRQIKIRREEHKQQLAYGRIDQETVPFLRGCINDLDWIEREIYELRQRAVEELDIEEDDDEG